jgi:hypothetical protein
MKGKVACECGCGVEVFQNQLTMVKVERAVDETLRQTTRRTFYVRRECKEAFEEELQCMALLALIVTKYPPPGRTRYWLVNAWLNPFWPWPRLLRAWWRRVGASLQVMRLQHAIFVRTRGFDYARIRARQSAILFGVPRFMQGFLSKRFTRKLIKAEKASEREKLPDGTRQEAAA